MIRLAYLGCLVLFGTECLRAGEPEIQAVRDAENSSRLPDDHPFGETPLERLVALACTDHLPECDKVVVYAIDLSRFNALKDGKKFSSPMKKTGSGRSSQIKNLGEKTLNASQSESVCNGWRNLTFSVWESAFCHYPAYGLRFYREDQLLYETTICWECSNFLLPDLSVPDSDGDDADVFEFEKGVAKEAVDPKRLLSRVHHYGFKTDANSKKLLALLQELLPHPQLTSESPDSKASDRKSVESD